MSKYSNEKTDEFIQEVAALSKLNHKRIVHYYNVWIEDSDPMSPGNLEGDTVGYISTGCWDHHMFLFRQFVFKEVTDPN